MSVELSERMRRLPPYMFGQLNRIKYQKRRAGIDIIDLGMGNPNDPTPPPIVDKLCEAVRDPRSHRYSTAAGIFNLRREVAKYYRQRWGVKLDPEHEVVCVIGSKEGLSHLCLALLGPGDLALVPQPAFPIHIYGVTLADAAVIDVPLLPLDGLMERLELAVRNRSPGPKALILNFPHNPTTTVVDRGFFEDAVRFARKYGIIIIHDFAYCDVVFDDYEAPSFMQTPGAKDVGVEFTTMSKSYNMAGWRIGFCVGNSEIVQSLARVKGYYDYGIFQPVQIASIIAMRHCREYAREQAAVYQQRRDVLCEGLDRIGWHVEKPKGTMFVWVPIPQRFRHMSTYEFALQLMEKAEVAAAPGSGFGQGGEGYLRLALIENELRLKQAVRQIGRAFKS